MPKFHVVLYISGKSERSERTILNLRRMLDEEADGGYELTVCDVQVEPHNAEKEKILATPTLVLISPPPERRIVGDLFDSAKVLSCLGLTFRDGARVDNR